MISRRTFGWMSLATAALTGIDKRTMAAERTADTPTSSRTGRRPDGAYWGHGPESIDVASGNLCVAIPLFTVRSRGAKASLKLVYNSQDRSMGSASSGGVDLGYGIGWTLQFGAIRPLSSNGGKNGFVFTDTTGAEYRFTKVGNAYVSIAGWYMHWNEEQRVLSLNDGTQLLFASQSTVSEVDAGTLYPTRIMDRNGNFVTITYMPGRNETSVNSSGRIQKISDSRATLGGVNSDTYDFHYSGTHLAAITSSILGQEIAFSYTSPQASGSESGDGNMFLSTVKASGSTLAELNYNEQRRLIALASTNGGQLMWEYGNHTQGDVTLPQVTERKAVFGTGNSEAIIHRFDWQTNGRLNAQTRLLDQRGVVVHIWQFDADVNSNSAGLLTLSEAFDSGICVKRKSTNWAETAYGVPYRGRLTTILDPSTAHVAKHSESHLRDDYGNAVESHYFDYSDSLRATKSVYKEYLSHPEYNVAHLHNLCTRVVLKSSGHATEIMRHRFDTTPLVESAKLTHHLDESYGANRTIRGNKTESTQGTNVITTTYDVAGLVRSSKDGTGLSCQIGLSGQTASQASGTSKTVAIRYSGGRPVAVTRPTGTTTKASYDDRGRLATTTSASGVQTTIVRNDLTNTVTVSRGSLWSRTQRDGIGRLTKVEHGNADAVQQQRLFEYAAGGHSPTGYLNRVSSFHNPASTPRWSTIDRDSIGRPVRTMDLNGQTTSFTYRGNQTLRTTGPNQWVRTVRNAYGKLSQVTVPNATGSPLDTFYSYDAHGHLAYVKSPITTGVQERQFQRNNLGQIVSTIQPETGTVRRTYATDGTLESVVDQKKQRQTFTRDKLKRLTAVTRYDSAGIESKAESTRRFYDNNPFDPGFSLNTQARLAAVTWGSPTQWPGQFVEMYSYTKSGKLAGKRVLLRRGVQTLTLESNYQYDDQGRLIAHQYPDNGPLLKLSYDKDGRVQQILLDAEPILKDVAYDGSGRPLRMDILASSAGEYMKEERSYDDQGRVTRLTAGSISTASSQIPKVDLEYLYNRQDGKLSIETDHVGGAAVSYDYDSQGRLASALSSDQEWGLSFGYDELDNRVSQKVTRGSGYEHSATFDSKSNRMNNVEVKYDENGNMTQLPDLAMQYDIQNRISAVQCAGIGTEWYTYDEKSRRVLRRTDKGREVLSFYSGGKRIASFQIISTATGMSLKREEINVYVGSRMIKCNRKGLIIDRLGATRAWSDVDVAKTAKFFPFGEPMSSASIANADLPQLDGYTRDATGLSYAGRRYYYAPFGRFTSPDPTSGGVRRDRPASFNRYIFSNNDPLNRVDSNGLNDGSVTSAPGINGGTDYFITNLDGTEEVDHYDAQGNLFQVDHPNDASNSSDSVPQLSLSYNGSDAGSASDVANALGEASASVAVIGKVADTSGYLNSGFNVLDVPQAEWTPALNEAWVGDIIAEGEPVLVASDLTEANLLSADPAWGIYAEGYSVYGDELGLLLEAGYEFVTVEEAGELLLLLLLL